MTEYPSMMKFLFWIFTGGLPVLAEDKSEIISKWAADLQVEYKVLTNIDRADRGFKYQGKLAWVPFNNEVRLMVC